MIKLCEPQDCTGCEACRSVCPVNAIMMSPQGSVLAEIPVIDSSKCIECHACERVCPVFHPIALSSIKAAYAGIAKEKNINDSSASGGASFLIGKEILQEGGVVYGAVNVGRYFFHKRIGDISELHFIQGSKYVKSYLRGSYKDVKKDLTAGRKVVFFGTPCQIAGLRSFLKKDYDLLITVDLICHGTPSQELLQRHIDNVLRSDEKIDKIKFRDKGYVLKFLHGNRVLYENNVWKERFKDAYYSAFVIGSCSMRDSCYTCVYANPKRVSDITIGDFWGVDRNVKFSRNPSGISVILPITEKGDKIVSTIRQEMEIFERPISEAINGNSQLRHPSILSKQGRKFRKFFNKGYSLKKALYLAFSFSLPYHFLRNILKR